MRRVRCEHGLLLRVRGLFLTGLLLARGVQVVRPLFNQLDEFAKPLTDPDQAFALEEEHGQRIAGDPRHVRVGPGPALCAQAPGP